MCTYQTDIKYLGVHTLLAQKKVLTEQSRRSSHRAANAVFGRIGRIATARRCFTFVANEMSTSFVIRSWSLPVEEDWSQFPWFHCWQVFLWNCFRQIIWTLLNLVSRISVSNCPVLFSASMSHNLTRNWRIVRISYVECLTICDDVVMCKYSRKSWQYCTCYVNSLLSY